MVRSMAGVSEIFKGLLFLPICSCNSMNVCFIFLFSSDSVIVHRQMRHSGLQLSF